MQMEEIEALRFYFWREDGQSSLRMIECELTDEKTMRRGGEEGCDQERGKGGERER